MKDVTHMKGSSAKPRNKLWKRFLLNGTEFECNITAQQRAWNSTGSQDITGSCCSKFTWKCNTLSQHHRLPSFMWKWTAQPYWGWGHEGDAARSPDALSKAAVHSKASTGGACMRPPGHLYTFCRPTRQSCFSISPAAQHKAVLRHTLSTLASLHSHMRDLLD